MHHPTRTHRILSIEALSELTTLLCQSGGMLCTGFRWRHFLLLNDSLRIDSIQEYAVILLPEGEERPSLQIESLAVSWMTSSRIQETLSHLEEHRQKLVRDRRPLDHGWPMARSVKLLLHPEGPCPLCQRS